MAASMRLSQLYYYLLAGGYTVFIAGFFFFPSSKSHSNFFYLAVALPLVIGVVTKKVDLKLIASSKSFRLIGLFLIYMVFTVFWGESNDLFDVGKYARRSLYILIFIVATMHLVHTSSRFLRRALVLVCWTAGIVALVYSTYYYAEHSFGTRLMGYGQLLNPVLAASMYGSVAIVSLYLLQQQRTVKSRLIYLAISLVSVFYMLLAQGRAPLLALVVTLLVWQVIASLLCKGNGHQDLLLVTIAAVCVLSVAIFLWEQGFLLEVMLRPIPHRVGIRVQTWNNVLSSVMEAPWFGHGLNADSSTIIANGQTILHPHNIYLATVFYGGVIGGVLLVTVVAVAIRKGFAQTSRAAAFLVTCMVLFGAICMLTDGDKLIHHPRPFWFFFWLPVALAAAAELPGGYGSRQGQATQRSDEGSVMEHGGASGELQ